MGTYPSKRMLEIDERIRCELERDYLLNVVFVNKTFSLPCKTQWAPHVVNQTFQTSIPPSMITTAAVRAHAAPSPYIKCDQDDD